MTTRILVIDDDTNLQYVLCEYFQENNYLTFSAFAGHEGITALQENGPFDIVILDIMMPDMDGFETLRQIRTLSMIPVIMLTARDDETDRVIGLEMGADDYMHKPFNPRELIARIKAILRRTSEPSDRKPLNPTGIIKIHSMTIDGMKRKVFKNGQDIFMSGVEFDILHELAISRGKTITRDHLLNIARGREFEAFDRSIDVHISRIRKKIEDNPAKPVFIKTIWGKGYSWSE
ncbi:MAG: response regulator transcription factor [Proteobacteria bacterium]|nr:response regulator transcription factor [Pseudomonadota bacterium]